MRLRTPSPEPDELASISAARGDRRHAAQRAGATAVHVYLSQKDNTLHVRDEFTDAAALGFHLQNTAADHFPQLLAIATPGPFFFLGDVPFELQQATDRMQLGAEFSTHTAGFDR